MKLFLHLAILLTASLGNAARNWPSQPIHFRKGHPTYVLSNELNKIRPSVVYTFAGKHGQHLKIKLVDVGKLVTMYHITFPKGETYGMKGYEPFNGKLTENGTYKIEVDVNQMATLATSGRFRLTLTRW